MKGSYLGPEFGPEETERRLAAAGAKFTVLSDDLLRTFELKNRTYQPCVDDFFPEVGLGLVPWQGLFILDL